MNLHYTLGVAVIVLEVTCQNVQAVSFLRVDPNP